MHHFHYRDGRLHAEDVDLTNLAAEVGTPFYCYSTATLERHYRVFAEAFAGDDALVCFAMKANSNQAVLRTLAARGAGMDIVSGGELHRALAAGVDPGKIVFSGVGKTRAEMRAPISIRVNPDVDAGTHAKISTGKYENKFGIPITRAPAVYAAAAALPGIAVHGVDMHIGSQITDLAPFADAARLLAGLARELMAAGHPLSHIDFGGGLGIPYRDDNAPPPDPAALAATLRPHFAPLGLRPVFEIGRMIVGNAGILVTRVLYVKHSEGRTFVIVDAAMNDLIRPTLYEAYHGLRPVLEPRPDTPRLVADVVGPVCESGDYLALNREMPEVKAGDLIAVMSAGAYGAVQSCTYNTRALVPEVLVRDDRAAVVRPRVEVEALVALDRVPDWLA
jgi:diaminopimelate decarboxylase